MKRRIPPKDTISSPSPWISGALKRLPAPPGPGERFPFEQLFRLQKLTLLPYIRSIVRTYGDLARINFSRVWVYLPSHPDDIREILQTRHRRFVKGFAADLIRDALGYSVFAAEGHLHRRQQKLMQPAFRIDAIERYAEMMLECFQYSDAAWEDGEPLQIVHEMHKLTMNVATRTLFNMPPGDKQDEVGEALLVLIRGISQRIATPMGVLKATFPILPDPEWRASLRVLDELIGDIIRQHETGALPNDDLLGQLMLAKDETGQGLSREQLRDEVLTLFVAGHETTAIALCWAWYEAAKNHTIQTRIQEEVAQVCGERTPCFADLPHLSYCRRVFQESLRHYPPIPVFLRQALEDIELRGYTVPRGSVFAISPYIVHHDPRFYPDPDNFNPDRWTEDFTEQLHKFAFIPFSGGPRVCIGERFAWTEGTLALAYFAQNWNFELLPYQDVKPGTMGTMRPASEIEMVVRRRDQGGTAYREDSGAVAPAKVHAKYPFSHGTHTDSRA
jgi:cytochrome P450